MQKQHEQIDWMEKAKAGIEDLLAARKRSDRKSYGAIVFRLFMETAFSVHLAAAAFYWWLSPKGFPIDHSRFWLNSVLPLAAIAVASFGLVATLQQWYRMAAGATMCFASAWAAAAICGRVLFPFSLAGLWGIGFVVAIVAAWWFVILNRSGRLPASRSTHKRRRKYTPAGFAGRGTIYGATFPGSRNPI